MRPKSDRPRLDRTATTLTVALLPMSLPTFPPPLGAYKREESPAGSPACRRYSHSRGRVLPRTGSTPVERDSSVSRDRSERADSRAPLVRRILSRTAPSTSPSAATSPPLSARIPKLLSHFLGYRPDPYVLFSCGGVYSQLTRAPQVHASTPLWSHSSVTSRSRLRRCSSTGWEASYRSSSPSASTMLSP